MKSAMCLASIVCLLLAACSGTTGSQSSRSNAQNSADDAKPQAIRLMLNWYPEAEHGGYYAALIHGFFADEGLDVTIVPGGPNAPVVQQVARGSIEFGVTNADRIVVGRAQDARLKAILAPLRNSPRCLLVHEASGITSFDQLQNVTIMMSQEHAWAQYLIQKLPLEGCKIVPNTASLAPFLADPRSAKQGYVISEPFVAQSEGVPVRSLLIAELGFNPYTSVLVVGERMAEQQPELVAKMTRACRQGWWKYLESPDQTNEHIHRLNPEMSREILAYGVQAIKQHCIGEQAADGALGEMSAERWKTLVEQLEELQMVPAKRVDPQSLFVDTD